MYRFATQASYIICAITDTFILIADDDHPESRSVTKDADG